MPLTENDTIRIRQFLQKLESGLIEGMQAYVTYHDSNLAATPSNPTGDGSTGGWHRLATEASNWMSVKTALKDTAGTWGTPIRVFGLQGTETAGVGLSADIPKLSQITFIGDGSSKVGWTAGTVEYGGNSYAIAVKAVGDGSTDAYIYWDDADGQTSFKTTGTFATAIAANHWVVCINDSGKAIPATSARILHGGLIQADTITAAKIIISGIDALQLTNAPAEAGADSTGGRLAFIASSMLPNWRLDLVDGSDRPAGIYPTVNIVDFSQVDWLDSGKEEIKILSTPDTVLGYGFPAIPIDDKQKYTVVIRHKSSAASVDGLYLRFRQYNAALPVGKTHIGHLGGPNTQDRTNNFTLVSNGAMPGTSWVVNEYTYTPTAGTKYASFNMTITNPTTAGVEYHVDYVLLTATSSWGHASDTTKIDGGKIYADSIVTDSLSANLITYNELRQTGGSEAVNTGCIRDDATRLYESATVAGYSSTYSINTWYSIIQDAITSQGGIVNINLQTSFDNSSGTPANINIEVKRGSTVIYSTTTTCPANDTKMVQYSFFDIPGAGAKTYDFRAKANIHFVIRDFSKSIALEESLGK